MSAQLTSAGVAIRLSFNDPEIIPDPYPLYDELRAGDGSCFLPMFDGTWLFFRYDDVRALLTDARLSSDRTSLPMRTLPLDQRARFADMAVVMRRWVGMKDPPDHRALRRHLNEVSKSHLGGDGGVIARAEPFVERLVGRVSSECMCDVIEEICRPLPALVIGDLLGAPLEDRLKLAGWTDDLAYVFGSSRLELADVERARRSMLALDAYTHALARDPSLPRTSFLHGLLSERSGGFALSEDEACAQCILLLFAGLEPTRYAIGNAVWALAGDPDQLALLHGRPDLLTSAVEEFLRYDSPVQWTGRIARESFMFRGRAIERGQVVLPYIAAANRDPECFSRPDVLDVERSPNPHLTFGHGSHHCLGAALVRVQTRLVLRALLRRFSSWEPDPGAPVLWNTNLGFHGHRSLPIRFAA